MENDRRRERFRTLPLLDASIIVHCSGQQQKGRIGKKSAGSPSHFQLKIHYQRVIAE
jgi:hypothetical protein